MDDARTPADTAADPPTEPSAESAAEAAADPVGEPSAGSAPADEPAQPEGDAKGRPKTAKSEQTRALILETAMRLFQERGYDKTTMRAIASEAGVSVGNAYYYYEGKEFLIQGFYDRMTHEHARDARARLAGTVDFSQRLQIALESWIDCAAPYHEFAAQFFRTAADPNSAMSPFSNESHPARETAVQIFREVLDGSDLGPKIDPELDELLPDLLWLHLMVIVLYWVFDQTDDTERTRAFVKRCAPFVAKIVSLSRYRVFRPLVRDAVGMVEDFVLPTIGRTAVGGRTADKKSAAPNRKRKRRD
ncbi:TetR/AcrR family transcriptional regulator [Kitasatospora kifunensis]|uniref:AcrR family transcriptional regulator n=1 Tax=Kitasatospora kifunensis TaxID=58351 RepID=A0A7W7VW13_KITKI|nr:TetR family transcriptional regulator [Kitasatospora kifunensis]MBB4924976.1 AcrR family transcriptional regulator [Kitasatospora kifunensis]